MYCTCGSGDLSGVYYDFTGQTNELQVHPTCRKPHRLYFERFTGMRCPKGAKAFIAIYGRADGINKLTFAMPDGSTETVEVLSTQPDAVLKIWKKLDQCMDGIMDTDSNGPEMISTWKDRARIYAEIICMCMPEHYKTLESVALEAKLRWESGDSEGEVTRHTPGLAEEVYSPPDPRTTGNNVPDAAVATVRQGIESGMFSIEDMAKAYEMTIAEIKSQLGLV